jgi:hypothetical protein
MALPHHGSAAHSLITASVAAETGKALMVDAAWGRGAAEYGCSGDEGRG